MYSYIIPLLIFVIIHLFHKKELLRAIVNCTVKFVLVEIKSPDQEADTIEIDP